MNRAPFLSAGMSSFCSCVSASTSFAPASIAASSMSASSFAVCASTRPTCSNKNLLLPGAPSCPRLKSWRISGAVRLLLSVSTSTISATLCGAYPSKTMCSITIFSSPMPAPFLIARSIASRVTELLRAFSTAAKSRAFESGSAPPSFAATAISLVSLPTAAPLRRFATSRFAWSHCRPIFRAF